MKQNFIVPSTSSFSVFLLLIVFLAVNILSLIFIKEVKADSDGLYCLETFGASPQIELDEGVFGQLSAGSEVTVSGSYKNPFAGNLYDVSIYAAIYRVGAEIPLNWTQLVSTDVVKANSDLSFATDWVIPSDLPAGDYEMKLFVDVGYNVIYSRLLSKTSSDYTTTFSVTGEVPDTTFLKEDTLTINDQVVSDSNVVIDVAKGAQEIEIEIGLNNTSSEFATGQIFIDVYSGTQAQNGQLVATHESDTSLLKDFPGVERISFPFVDDDYTVVIKHTSGEQEENILLALTTQDSDAREQKINSVLRYVTVGEHNGSPVVQACVTNTDDSVQADVTNYEYEVTHTLAVYEEEGYDVAVSEPTKMFSGQSYIGNQKPELAISVPVAASSETELMFLSVDAGMGPVTFVDFSLACEDCGEEKTAVASTNTGLGFNTLVLSVVAMVFALFVLPMAFFYGVAVANSRKKTTGQTVNTDSNDYQAEDSSQDFS